MPTMTPANDWLLFTARWGCRILRALLWLAIVGLVLMIPYILFAGRSEFAPLDAELAAAGAPLEGRAAFSLLVPIMAAIVILLERFLYQLQRIVESVGAGDPFAPENARRLERMGWLLLASQIVASAALAFSWAVAEMADKLEIDGDLSVEALFAVVLLFILARVFRHGAAMRDDLEGTV